MHDFRCSDPDKMNFKLLADRGTDKLVLGGILLLALGLLGEHIGRIYLCLNNAPQYVIKTVLNYPLKTPSQEHPPSYPDGR